MTPFTTILFSVLRQMLRGCPELSAWRRASAPGSPSRAFGGTQAPPSGKPVRLSRSDQFHSQRQGLLGHIRNFQNGALFVPPLASSLTCVGWRVRLASCSQFPIEQAQPLKYISLGTIALQSITKCSVMLPFCVRSVPFECYPCGPQHALSRRKSPRRGLLISQWSRSRCAGRRFRQCCLRSFGTEETGNFIDKDKH